MVVIKKVNELVIYLWNGNTFKFNNVFIKRANNSIEISYKKDFCFFHYFNKNEVKETAVKDILEIIHKDCSFCEVKEI